MLLVGGCAECVVETAPSFAVRTSFSPHLCLPPKVTRLHIHNSGQQRLKAKPRINFLGISTFYLHFNRPTLKLQSFDLTKNLTYTTSIFKNAHHPPCPKTPKTRLRTNIFRPYARESRSHFSRVDSPAHTLPSSRHCLAACSVATAKCGRKWARASPTRTTLPL